jgi:hypothetical protein
MAVVTRRAIAAIVFCTAILVTLGVAVLHPPDAAGRGPSVSIEAAPSGCAPADDDAAWTGHHRVAAAVTDWAARCRTLHAHVLPGVVLPRPAARVAGAPGSPERTPLAPSYLLHTPLLI